MKEAGATYTKGHAEVSHQDIVPQSHAEGSQGDFCTQGLERCSSPLGNCKVTTSHYIYAGSA